jgi:hypothetical protein
MTTTVGTPARRSWRRNRLTGPRGAGTAAAVAVTAAAAVTASLVLPAAPSAETLGFSFIPRVGGPHASFVVRFLAPYRTFEGRELDEAYYVFTARGPAPCRRPTAYTFNPSWLRGTARRSSWTGATRSTGGKLVPRPLQGSHRLGEDQLKRRCDAQAQDRLGHPFLRQDACAASAHADTARPLPVLPAGGWTPRDLHRSLPRQLPGLYQWAEYQLLQLPGTGAEGLPRHRFRVPHSGDKSPDVVRGDRVVLDVDSAGEAGVGDATWAGSSTSGNRWKKRSSSGE